MARRHTFKRDLDFIKLDRTDQVRFTWAQAKEPLSRVPDGRMDAKVRERSRALGSEMDAVLKAFEAQNGEQRPGLLAERSKLYLLDLLRMAIFWFFLFLGFVLLFSRWQVGLLMMVLAIAANIVARRILSKKADEASDRALAPSGRAIAHLGTPETPTAPPRGLGGQADEHYLSTLTEIELMTERNRRQSERQMAAQQQQHDAQMAMMQQSMAVQRQALDQQHLMNDYLGDMERRRR